MSASDWKNPAPPKGSDERSFLHDIANPLGTTVLLLDMALEGLRAHSALIPSEVEHVANSLKEIERAVHMAIQHWSESIKRRSCSSCPSGH